MPLWDGNVQDPCISKQNSSVTPQVCGVHISLFIPTTGSVRVAHYTCGYFSVARFAGLKSAAPIFAKPGREQWLLPRWLRRSRLAQQFVYRNLPATA